MEAAMSFKRILIPIDGSPQSACAVRTGLDLAKALGAAAATVYVVEPPVADSGEIGIPAEGCCQTKLREAGFALPLSLFSGSSHRSSVTTQGETRPPGILNIQPLA
jgi:hypothetical protein